MRVFAISVAAIMSAAVFAPLPSSAQIAVDVPGVGVRIGDRPHYRSYDRYDAPVVRERRIYRERDVGMLACAPATAGLSPSSATTAR